MKRLAIILVLAACGDTNEADRFGFDSDPFEGVWSWIITFELQGSPPADMTFNDADPYAQYVRVDGSCPSGGEFEDLTHEVRLHNTQGDLCLEQGCMVHLFGRGEGYLTSSIRYACPGFEFPGSFDALLPVSIGDHVVLSVPNASLCDVFEIREPNPNPNC